MIKEFQEILKNKNINYYILPTDDDHSSEYVGDYYKARAYLSGFTGSAGTLLVTQNDAYLWTDGRYFLQASKQLTEVQLMKMGNPGVPTLKEFIMNNIKENETIGFDASTMSSSFAIDLKNALTNKIIPIDLISDFWTDRPERSHNEVYHYEIEYTGKSESEKLSDIRKEMNKNNCKYHLLSTLDDIAWTFNLRGSDINCIPVALAFALINDEDATIYLQDGTYSKELEDLYKNQKIYIKSYDSIYDDLKEINETILVDLNTINYALYSNIQNYKHVANPSQIMKACKNDVEIKNTRQAHIKDGVAMVQLMKWLKERKNKDLDEMLISEMVTHFRSEQEGFKDISFASIVGIDDNAAIIHYQPTLDSYKEFNGGLLLIDSGGQYIDGTTDITRMYALSDISDEAKKDSTLVLKGWLHLMNAVFLKGSTGQSLDILARQPLLQEYMNFNHGTGHGVGHFLSVHEGPHGIRTKPMGGYIELMPGMVVTDEPGVYKEGKHGIRWENELLVKELETNEYGQFYGFESLTVVPVDLEAIDLDLLDNQEKKWLNKYHKYVYDTLKDYVDDIEYLQSVTHSI